MDNSVLVIIALAVVAGGGIIVIDGLVIRKIRRLGPPSKPRTQDRRIDR